MILVRPTIRPLERKDIEEVIKILKESEFYIHGIDWSDFGSNWIVAEHKGEVIGCIQIAFAKPLGYLNFWAIKNSYEHSGAGIRLSREAERLLSQYGSDGFIAITNNEKVCKHIREGLGLILGSFDVFVKRVWRQGKIYGSKSAKDSSATSASADTG